MSQKRIKLLIIAFLCLVIVFLVIFIFFSGKDKEPGGALISPTPTSSFGKITSPSPGKEGRGSSIEDLNKDIYSKYPLLDSVPYQETDFKIDYVKPLTFEVFLKTDTPAVRQKVLDWITSKGVDPQTHEIIWKVNPGL